MVEARAQGASTTEAIRVGTAYTGRIITAAALILIVVTGAFGFSQLVMMQYIAYGMIAALIIDATLIRMFLVPSIMKLLGDDCWWAPAWMKRIQERIGLAEPILTSERMPDDVPDLAKMNLAADPGTVDDVSADALTTPMPKIGNGTAAKRDDFGNWFADLPPKPNRRDASVDPQPAGEEPAAEDPSAEDESGRHHRTSQSVSVSELLRRRNQG
jgi:RND superfamily putative drug exporter